MITNFYSSDVSGKTYQYCFSLYSVIMVILGGDIQPINQGQSFLLVVVVMIG